MNWWYVYVLRSKKSREIYIGSTNDLKRRINDHNAGLCKATKRYVPWTLEMSVAVKTEDKARELEKYFKSGSGKAILEKRFL